MHNKLECSNLINSKTSIFKNLNKEQRASLQQQIICKSYKKGELIYEEGEQPMGLMFLCEGKVKVIKQGIRQQIVRLPHAENIMGFRAFFANDCYMASAVALEKSLVCLVNKRLINSLIRQNSKFGLSLIQEFATELGFSEKRTVALTQKHIRGRLADSLLELIKIYGFKDDNKTINIDIARKDLACFANMTASNVIRTLKNFQTEGVINLESRYILVADYDRLKRISDKG